MRLFPTRAVMFGMCLTALGWLAPQAVHAQGWGNLEGQFVYDGTPPDVPPLVKKGDPTAKDPTVCAAQDIPNETLVVDPATKGIKDIVVYLRRAPSAIHPDLKKSDKDTVGFDQKGCRFLPHILVVRTDQKVKCVSSDSVPHNVNITPFSNRAQNFIVQPNDQAGMTVEMPVPESRATLIKCDIHPWMRAYWFVLDHPYIAVTDETGKFKIEKIPAGKHTFTVWQDKSGYIEAKMEVEIKPGETTNLGTVKVAPSKFKD